MTQLPSVVNMPTRYNSESEPNYNKRVYRWRVWLSHEPRPDLWYSDENEIRQYKQWKNGEQT